MASALVFIDGVFIRDSVFLGMSWADSDHRGKARVLTSQSERTLLLIFCAPDRHLCMCQ